MRTVASTVGMFLLRPGNECGRSGVVGRTVRSPLSLVRLTIRLRHVTRIVTHQMPILAQTGMGQRQTHDGISELDFLPKDAQFQFRGQ